MTELYCSNCGSTMDCIFDSRKMLLLAFFKNLEGRVFYFKRKDKKVFIKLKLVMHDEDDYTYRVKSILQGNRWKDLK